MPTGRKTRSEKTTLGGPGTAPESTGGTATLALTILYQPCLTQVGHRAVLTDLASDRPALLSRTEPAFAPRGEGAGEPLGDEHMSRRPLRLTAADSGGVELSLAESGTVVIVRGQRVRESVVFSAAQIQRGVVLELGHRVVLLLHPVASIKDVLDAALPAGEDHEIIGQSDGFLKVLWEIRSVADLVLPVLLRGETGSGKEIVARAIHRASPRRERPFVAVNLGAVSPSLAVAELFGAERGAYTGSVQRHLGYFEQARGGTLFLDEIGEAPVELQSALLRVLETGEMQTVGAPQIRKADVRIIAATDADLEAKVAGGTFRAPLVNRLSTYEIWIPPLRERRDDIGRLLACFLREELGATGEIARLSPPAPGDKLWLPSSLVARLADYDWPGNVRQLRNVVRQLVIGNRGRERVEAPAAVDRLLAESKAVSRADPSPAREPAPAGEAASTPPARRKPADVTEAELREALLASRWDLAAAAQRLGISRASIYLLIEKNPRLRTAADLTAEEITRCHRASKGDIAKMAEKLEVSERALLRRVRDLGLD